GPGGRRRRRPSVATQLAVRLVVILRCSRSRRPSTQNPPAPTGTRPAPRDVAGILGRGKHSERLEPVAGVESRPTDYEEFLPPTERTQERPSSPQIEDAG